MNTVLFSHKLKGGELKGEEEIDSIAKLELDWLAAQLREAKGEEGACTYCHARSTGSGRIC